MEPQKHLSVISRRTFIRATATLASGAAFLPLAIASAKPAEDFLILPKGTPAPQTLAPPSPAGFPTRRRTFKSATAIARQLPFPMYAVPEGSDLALLEASARIGKNENIESATLVYGSEQPYEPNRDWSLSITATRSFQRPIIFWNDEQSETVFAANFLPRPGIITISHCGPIFRWIEKSTLYQIQTHSSLSVKQAQERIASLKRVS